MSDKPKTVGEQILERIKALEGMLRLLSLEKKLEDLEKRVNSIGYGEKIEKDQPKEEKSGNLKEALNNLEEFTTVKKDKEGKRTFLLHRPTPDFEYGKSAEDNIYETSEKTDWIAEIEAAEDQQQKKNPVVSIWVPEDKIADISGADANTGTWGNLGTNPHATKYKIWVSPGKYEIYQELRQ